MELWLCYMILSMMVQVHELCSSMDVGTIRDIYSQVVHNLEYK